jgi:hypothetical protein
MKKKPAKKQGQSKRKSRAFPSTHLIAQHAEHIQELVHGALAEAGIHDLALRAMHFDSSESSSGGCPPNEHREMVCTTGPNGAQICESKCVPN